MADDSSSSALSSGSYYDLYLSNLLSYQNGPLYYFYRQLYNISGTTSTEVDTTADKSIKFEQPDINGYTLMFMLPAHLSGYGYTESYGGDFGDCCKFICFCGMDFTPPAAQVQTDEVSARSGSLHYATGYEASGQLSISFIDNQNSIIFSYHKVWINYIEDILRGIDSRTGKELKPAAAYLTEDNEKFGEIDYATSAFVIRFKPSARLGYSEINYIGKATGVFPLNIPDKEEIGRRDSNELIMLPMTYTCTLYRSFSPHAAPNGDQHEYIYKEFKSLIASVYGSTAM